MEGASYCEYPVTIAPPNVSADLHDEGTGSVRTLELPRSVIGVSGSLSSMSTPSPDVTFVQVAAENAFLPGLRESLIEC
jgi:hypothetical protein